MAALQEAFGERLLFAGVQGSYLRGEARPDSDIDLLVVLDHVDLTDLDHFHEAMHNGAGGRQGCRVHLRARRTGRMAHLRACTVRAGHPGLAWRPARFASRLWSGRCPAWREGERGEPLSHDQPHVSDDAGAACGCPSGRFARPAQGVLLLLADRPRSPHWRVRPDQVRTAAHRNACCSRTASTPTMLVRRITRHCNNGAQPLRNPCQPPEISHRYLI